MPGLTDAERKELEKKMEQISKMFGKFEEKHGKLKKRNKAPKEVKRLVPHRKQPAVIQKGMNVNQAKQLDKL